jgi:1,2-diacylglycerol 3-alpha-glucosyltransferase
MIRVGIVTEWFDRGSSYVSAAYKETLEQQGAEVFIYARNEHLEVNAKAWTGKNVWIGKQTKLPFGKAIDKKDFENWIEVNNLNYVVFNEQIWIAPVLWAKKKGLICLAYVDYYTDKTRFDFEIYDALLCNTRRHLSAFTWHPNTIFIQWGIDLDKYCVENNEKKSEIVFLHSCGWSPIRKGTKKVLKAFAEVPDSSKLRIFTQQKLDQELQDIVDQIKSKKGTKSVDVMVGTFSGPEIYKDADVYVYPTQLEGIGLSQAEALASGIPIIVPNFPPMNEFLGDGVSRGLKVVSTQTRTDGYYWPTCEIDYSELAKVMSEFCQSAENRSMWKISARAHAVENFDWSINSKDLLSKMQKIERLKIGMRLRIKIQYRYFELLPLRKVSPLLWRIYKELKSL